MSSFLVTFIPMEISVTLFSDGMLFGFTHYGKNDKAFEYESEDWNELNIYFIILKLSLKWW
tara:strand:- start:70 stop:252 length:183 start_codon:yes stop_codon:yes gene_type:complete